MPVSMPCGRRTIAIATTVDLHKVKLTHHKASSDIPSEDDLSVLQEISLENEVQTMFVVFRRHLETTLNHT